MFQKKKKTLFSFWKCAFLPNHFEMKSRQTWRCSQRVRCSARASLHSLPTALFQGVYWTQVAALLREPHSRLSQKVPGDGIFHNKEGRLWFPIFDVLRRSSRGRDQCLRSCIKQSSYTENQQKLKQTERTSTFWGKEKKKKQRPCEAAFARRRSQHQIDSSVFYRICADRFSSHMERTCTAQNTGNKSLPADWLLKCSCGWLRLALAVNWCKASVRFPSPPQETWHVLWSPAKHLHSVYQVEILRWRVQLKSHPFVANADEGVNSLRREVWMFESNKLLLRSRVESKKYCCYICWYILVLCVVRWRHLRWQIIVS